MDFSLFASLTMFEGSNYPSGAVYCDTFQNDYTKKHISVTDSKLK